MHELIILFGREEIRNYENGEQLSPDELQTNVKRFSFNSAEEAAAFLKGIDEAVGWDAWLSLDELPKNQEHFSE